MKPTLSDDSESILDHKQRTVLDRMDVLVYRINAIKDAISRGHNKIAEEHYSKSPAICISAFGMQELNRNERSGLRRAFENASISADCIVATSNKDNLIEISGTFDIEELAKVIMWK